MATLEGDFRDLSSGEPPALSLDVPSRFFISLNDPCRITFMAFYFSGDGCWVSPDRSMELPKKLLDSIPSLLEGDCMLPMF